MACKIDNIKITGLNVTPAPTGTGKIATSVRISGTAAGCAMLTVEMQCRKALQPFVYQNVNVRPDGTWEVEIDGECGCDENTSVTVTCNADPNCTKSVSLKLDCAPPPSPCPSVKATAEDKGCKDGKRVVEFVVSIDNTASSTAAVGQIAYGDGNNAASLVAGAKASASGTWTYSYPVISPKNLVPTFELTFPPKCKSSLKFDDKNNPGNPFVYMPCPAQTQKCPEPVLTIEKPASCAGNGQKVSVTAKVTSSNSIGLSGCSFTWVSGIKGATDITGNSPSQTFTYDKPDTYAIAANIVCGSCKKLVTGTLKVEECCPSKLALKATVDGCVGNGKQATITVFALPDLAGTYEWSLDGKTQSKTQVGTTKIKTSLVKNNTVEVVFTPKGSLNCPALKAKIVVHVPQCDEPGVCPDLKLEVDEPQGCAGNGQTASIKARVSPDIPGTHKWSVDGKVVATTTSGAEQTFKVAKAAQVTLSVTVTPQQSGCPEFTDRKTVTVKACPDGGGTKTKPKKPEKPPIPTTSSLAVALCMAARILGIALVSGAAALSIVLLACSKVVVVPPPVWYVIAGVAVVGLALLLIWGFLCKKPCKWGLLLIWQCILLIGLGLMLLSNCCPTQTVFWIGAGLTLVGLGLSIWWWVLCQVHVCVYALELSLVVSVMIMPLVTILPSVPVLAACVNKTAMWIIGVIATLLALLSGTCKLSQQKAAKP